MTCPTPTSAPLVYPSRPAGLGDIAKTRWRAALTVALMMAAVPAGAHDVRLGTLTVDHPYAVVLGEGTVGIHALRLINRSGQPERLLGLRCEGAQGAALRDLRRPSGDVEVAAIDLPAASVTPLRHDGPWQLRCEGLPTTLRDGDPVRVQWRFERAGTLDLVAHVQTPRRARTPHAH